MHDAHTSDMPINAAVSLSACFMAQPFRRINRVAHTIEVPDNIVPESSREVINVQREKGSAGDFTKYTPRTKFPPGARVVALAIP